MSQVVEQETTAERTSMRTDAGVVAVAVVAAVGAWVLWTQVAGVDLVVRTGNSDQAMSAVAVVVSALVPTVFGVGLLRFLERRMADGLRVWTILASGVFVVSLLGPLGATTAEGKLALASLHLVVTLVLVIGLRGVRRRTTRAA